eukprot:COSAG02_NODE_130_length_34758_cov_80.817767_9_plen_275_part_00
MGPLTPAELKQFERDGAVTVDTTFTLTELDAAESGWDALAAAQREMGSTGDRQGYREMGVRAWPKLSYDGATIEVLQHPWFEAVTKQALRAEQALFFQQSNNLVLPTRDDPHPDGQWEAGAHCDTQLTTSDWEATPRRTVLCFWLWLSDVPGPERGAMRFGAHLLAKWNSQRNETPRNAAALIHCDAVSGLTARRSPLLSLQFRVHTCALQRTGRPLLRQPDASLCLVFTATTSKNGPAATMSARRSRRAAKWAAGYVSRSQCHCLQDVDSAQS